MLIKTKWLILAASLCLSSLHATDDNVEYPHHYAGKPGRTQIKEYIDGIENGVRKLVPQLPADFKFDWLEIGYASERLSPAMGVLLLVTSEYNSKENYATALRQEMADRGFVMDNTKLAEAKINHTTTRLRESWYTKPALEHWDRKEEIRQNPVQAILQALHDVARCEKGDGNAEGNPEALAKRGILETAETELQGLLDGLKPQEKMPNEVLPTREQNASVCGSSVLVATCVVVPVLAYAYTQWSQWNQA